MIYKNPPCEDEFEKNKLCRSALGSSAGQGLSDDQDNFNFGV